MNMMSVLSSIYRDIKPSENGAFTDEASGKEDGGGCFYNLSRGQLRANVLTQIYEEETGELQEEN